MEVPTEGKHSLSARCTSCGEELLGAVNRCWKCGAEFPSLGDTAGEPPVRRAPPGGSDAAQHAESSAATAAAGPDVTAARTTEKTAVPIAEGRLHRPPMTAVHPASPGAGWAAVVAFFCGLLAAGSMWFSFLAVVPSFLGVALGSWGLHSRRRGVATCGLVLCIVALAIAGFIILVEVYAYFTGSHPFLQPREVLPDDPNDLLDRF